MIALFRPIHLSLISCLIAPIAIAGCGNNQSVAPTPTSPAPVATTSESPTTPTTGESPSSTAPSPTPPSEPTPSPTTASAGEPRESPWICLQVGEEWQDVSYHETQNYLVNLCRHKADETSYLYVGVNRKTGDWINLPASPWKGAYAAKNGNITYTVTDSSLVVYQDGNVIVDEPFQKTLQR